MDNRIVITVEMDDAGDVVVRTEISLFGTVRQSGQMVGTLYAIAEQIKDDLGANVPAHQRVHYMAGIIDGTGAKLAERAGCSVEHFYDTKDATNTGESNDHD